MKKIAVLIVILLLLGNITYAEARIGDEIGDVLYTDIVTKLNGVSINSFNINGRTAVYVTELRKLGYDVKWDGEERVVRVNDNPANEIITEGTEGISAYQQEKKNLKVGTPIEKVLHTDIVTELEGQPIESFNINGSTAIFVNDMTKLGIELQWDSDNREVLLKRKPREQKVIKELDEYQMVDIEYLGDNNYELNIDSIPDDIYGDVYSFVQYGSNTYKSGLSDSEILNRLYEYEYSLSSQKLDESKWRTTFDNQSYGEAFYYKLINKDGELIGIIPIEYGRLEKKDFQVRIIEPDNYDYNDIIKAKKEYIEMKLENAYELKDEWVDLVKFSEEETYTTMYNVAAYLNSNAPEEYHEDFYYTTRGYFSHKENTTRGRLLDHLESQYDEKGTEHDITNSTPSLMENGSIFDIKSTNDYVMLYFQSMTSNQLLYYRVNSSKVVNEQLEDEYKTYEITYDQKLLEEDEKSYFSTALKKYENDGKEDVYIEVVESYDNKKIVGPFKDDFKLTKDDFVDQKYIISIQERSLE